MASHADSAHDLLDLDIQTLRQYVELFPHEGLSKVLTGYLRSGASKYPLEPDEPEAPDLSEGGVALNEPFTQEDCLVMMTEGLLEAKTSPLAHCLLADYYLSLEEYESAVETTRKGLKLAGTESKKTDLPLQRIKDALSSTLATALVYYQTPRNHPEAKEIFRTILKRKPQFTSALIGIGLILEEEEEHGQAIEFLDQALKQDPKNGRIGAELAWCQALSGDYETGLVRLQEYLEFPQMDASKQRGRELRAQTLYRIGVCMWELDPSKAARKSRQGPYAKFLAAIKADPNFAPAYTKLGIYYEEYSKDRKRARQCFQKAFELSPSELVAAERLARSFADQGEWDIVEVVSQRVVDSGKVRAAPGSKKKSVSWPFSALGVVQMNKQEYSKSIISFLSALRISPDDYHSYVGLGESYHNSGRYNSAQRTFTYAESPADGVVMKKTGEASWFTKYMLANVNRELGEFDEAIKSYEEVLAERPEEFGVSIALLQTLVDKCWRCVEIGFFAEAGDTGRKVFNVATAIVKYKPDAFNLWRAVGDALAMFSWVQLAGLRKWEPWAELTALLRTKSNVNLDYNTHKDIDGIGQLYLDQFEKSKEDIIAQKLKLAILAHKRAIASCAGDTHAQAVAWYNLGWTEYRTHVCLEQELSDQGLTTFLRAAMKCFKRAIELEAGNSEFWNALGVMTTTLSPKVAQHAFVRSLHLNERSVRAWTNLGTLYLLQNDQELAHSAFSRAQSTDPDYGLAWVGEGIVALLFGDTKEALSHFTHAFELSDSSSFLTKRQYAASTFDYLVSSPSAETNITHLIQPLFALYQLKNQAPYDVPHQHLAALYMERIGDHSEAASELSSISGGAEEDYEKTESVESLAYFARAKADLARNELARGEYEGAVEGAEICLSLLEDFDTTANPVISANELSNTRLGARLTAGLAYFHNGDLEASIPYFRQALEDTRSNPDIICLLAEVLWAKGGETEKEVAREQLFAAAEKHSKHVGIVTLLGAIAVLDDDTATMQAVRDDLSALRTDASLTLHDITRVEKITDAIAMLLGGEEEELAEARRTIMMAPWKHTGWQELAEISGEGYPAIMARETARRSVPPIGALDAKGLANAFAGTGNVKDAQRAVVLAPWSRVGWSALAECVKAA